MGGDARDALAVAGLCGGDARAMRAMAVVVTGVGVAGERVVAGDQVAAEVGMPGVDARVHDGDLDAPPGRARPGFGGPCDLGGVLLAEERIVHPDALRLEGVLCLAAGGLLGGQVEGLHLPRGFGVEDAGVAAQLREGGVELGGGHVGHLHAQAADLVDGLEPEGGGVEGAQGSRAALDDELRLARAAVNLPRRRGIRFEGQHGSHSRWRGVAAGRKGRDCKRGREGCLHRRGKCHGRLHLGQGIKLSQP
ncbi:hypothetical protein D3C87_762720 [compost metagenome]